MFDLRYIRPLDARLTGTAGSAAAIYFEAGRAGSLGEGRTHHDFRSIRVFAERYHERIVHWTEHDRGGHFASLEVPELLLADVRAFFSSLR